MIKLIMFLKHIKLQCPHYRSEKTIYEIKIFLTQSKYYSMRLLLISLLQEKFNLFSRKLYETKLEIAFFKT